MSVLSDHEIWSLLGSGRLKIDPPPQADAVKPSSVDLRLANDFQRPKPMPRAITGGIDTRNSGDVMQAIHAFADREVVQNGGSFVLRPGEFALAWTVETITLPNFLCARVEGRSTMARLGLSVHQTAPTVHATFTGRLQLELRNAGTYELLLYPHTAICQLIIETMSSPSMKSLVSVHQGTTSPQ
jgi:dCTP deaminase